MEKPCKTESQKTIIFLRLRIITEAISYQMKRHCSLLLIFFLKMMSY